MDLFSRVVIRGRIDERGELAEVTQEIARRGFKARRLYARDFAPKKILRSYAAADGKVFYVEGTDMKMLEKESLRRWLTPETSELSRRPCCNLSMAGKSVAGMVGVLVGPASASEKELGKLFSGKAGDW